jgi:hypothetical protein
VVKKIKNTASGLACLRQKVLCRNDPKYLFVDEIQEPVYALGFEEFLPFRGISYVRTVM